MRKSSSDDTINGGTVSMCVEKTISGRPCPGHVASTFARAPSTGIFRASHPAAAIHRKENLPPPSFGVIDSISTSRRVSANSSMQQKSNSRGESRWSPVILRGRFVCVERTLLSANANPTEISPDQFAKPIVILREARDPCILLAALRPSPCPDTDNSIFMPGISGTIH
jgi:hypothetical protein